MYSDMKNYYYTPVHYFFVHITSHLSLQIFKSELKIHIIYTKKN